MSDTPVPPPHLSDTPDADVAEYRTLSGMAVTGLVFGVLSVLGALTPWLWFLAWIGVVLSALGLRRIAQRAPALTGRWAAVAGLVLSVFLASAAPAEWYTYREMLRGQARQFAGQWFQCLRGDEPQKAYQLTRHPAYRKPLDGRLWSYYGEGTELRDELQNYVARPEVRALLALGKKAQVRYYDTQRQWRENQSDMAYQVYAVTYEERGRKKTFFMGLVLARHELVNTRKAEWQVSSSEGGIRPVALGGKPDNAR